MRVIIFTILVLLLAGCESNTKYNEVSKNLSDSNQQVSKLENELNIALSKQTDLNEKVKKLENELDELKNGAKMSIVEIRIQYENKNYDKVVQLSKILHNKFLGVPEDIEAQKMVKDIQKIKEAEAEKAAEDKAKLLVEQTQSAQTKARSIMRISDIYPSEPNSAGGVDLTIVWKNNSDKVIKYVVFSVEPYNAVNDVVSSEIGSGSTFNGKETGPFKKGKGSSGNTYWENAWYNSTIKTVKLIKVEIEYMDGTMITLENEDLIHIRY